MKVLITGACGFVGSRLLCRLRESLEHVELWGLDNFCRAGSETNRPLLKELGVKFIHGDVRSASDFESLPAVDWVIDAAANSSVLAGVDGRSSSRQVIEHNFGGTVNMLEYCRRQSAGFVLLSTSRVYSVSPLSALPLRANDSRFILDVTKVLPSGVTDQGVNEDFSTTPPLSLYGVTKKMSEDLAAEYAAAFDFPVWINRCGVMAGAGQFGRADQGIIAYWIHSWRERRPLKYLGFGSSGKQVRDALHPYDLADLLVRQIQSPPGERIRVGNVSGGLESSFSLAELSAWCAAHFDHEVPVERSGVERPFDIAWLVLDDTRTRQAWDWKPRTTREELFAEVAAFAERHPDWISLSASA